MRIKTVVIGNTDEVDEDNIDIFIGILLLFEEDDKIIVTRNPLNEQHMNLCKKIFNWSNILNLVIVNNNNNETLCEAIIHDGRVESLMRASIVGSDNNNKINIISFHNSKQFINLLAYFKSI